MSKSKHHKIQIRQKPNTTGIMTGANSQVLLDGKILKYVKSVKFEVAARDIAVVRLELYGDIDVIGTLGDLAPTAINLKETAVTNGPTD